MRLKEIYGISAGKYFFFLDGMDFFFYFLHKIYSNFPIEIRWQRLENPKDDSDPNHHDVAILITRKDICSQDGCT